MKTPAESPYMLSRDVMAYLKLGSLTALYSLIKEYHLPHCRRGGVYLFDRRDVDAWLHGYQNSVDYVRARRKAEAECPRP